MKFKLLLSLVSLSIFAAERPKPNVILVVTDDLGWQDVKCYDIDKPSPYETPNIDQLSKEGVKFWQAYSPAPTCAPSRGAILAGKHPARLQRTHVVGGAPPIPHHEKVWSVVSPWYRGRLEVKENTINEALKSNGYVSGHVGKWHIAISHHSYPQPKDHGFDFSRSNLGVSANMKPHRLSGFATKVKDDPYRLDENGFPYHENSEDALDFIRENKNNPFFLYYATWLVHTPIVSRSRELLEKYCTKLGIDFPTDPKGWDLPGQQNPYYAAMVEMLDYYMGQMFTYLKETDDPRWPGHKLIENTYIIFTSDNGGMEKTPGEIITDNYPLDRGKINAKEGGIRVPLIITGPGIKAKQESQVMVNGLDFFPTILSWTGSQTPREQDLDGADISTLLTKDPSDPSLVKNHQGEVRNSIMHHFPNSYSMHSTMRIGDYKLIRNYKPEMPPFELYQLYKDGERVDIEESKNLAKSMPEKVHEMNRSLQEQLEEMDASFPFLNPYTSKDVAYKDKVCKVISTNQKGDYVTAQFKENGNQVQKAYLLYTDNGGEKYEEWYRIEAQVSNGQVSASLPAGTTHYIFNLVDEHRFLMSYPRMGQMNQYTKGNYSTKALKAK